MNATTLRGLRKAAGLTQAQVAFFATENGEGVPTVSKLETGKINPSRATSALYVLLSLLSERQREDAKRLLNEIAPPRS